MMRTTERSGGEPVSGPGYVGAQVGRAQERERARHARRLSMRAAAAEAAAALRERYGKDVVVHVFGSMLDAGRFRLDSDIDLAVLGVPADRYYEAWAVAEAAAGVRVDLVWLEAAPGWLAAEVLERGERLV
jgi:predicted nucleotidyltransferase